MQESLTAGGLGRAPDLDFPIAIVTIPATAEQRRTAVIVIVVLLIVALAVLPFANIQLARVNTFVPVLQTVLALADLVTAVLLFAQYLILPRRALLAVASAYLCSASFAFLQTLTFPGAYSPAGLIGDGFNSPAWLFVLWHVTFPLGIVVYALLKDKQEPTLRGRLIEREIGLTLLCVFAAISAAAWLVTAQIEALPVFYTASVTQQTRLGNQVNVGLLLWYGLVLAVLLARRRTILDVWLVVILIAWMPNFFVAAIASSVRFSLGWYAARGFALIASFMLLSVLLTEMTVLYSRLANAFSLLSRERANRLMSVDAATAAIAHEVRAPLSAIMLNAGTALSQLRTMPHRSDEMDDIVRDIERDAQRAGEVLSSIRAIFKTAPDSRTTISLQELARQALSLSEPDLLSNQVSVTTAFPEDEIEVRADVVQTQQVILNLIRNAIEAMDAVAPEARRLTLTTRIGKGSNIILAIQDTGAGVLDEDRNRIFDAFFTTKRSGTGLGLAISRTIVEAHGGTLRVAESGPGGSTLEITLPIASA